MSSLKENVGYPKGFLTVRVKRKDSQDWETICEMKPNLLTTVGRDFLHAQGYSTGPGANGANYIALTTDAAPAAAGDTTLASEIVANGLERVQGAYAHTGSSNTTTITKTFTASGSFTAVQKAGLFTAGAVGTMVHENTFSSVNLIALDLLQVTWTITLA